MTARKDQPPIIVLINSDALQLYAASLTDVVNLPYPSGSVIDLEIKSGDSLTESVRTMLAREKIKPSRVIFLLGESICFEKDFPIDGKDHQEETLTFLDTIPFEYIKKRSYSIGKQSLLVAVNKDFCDQFVDMFIKQNFIPVAATPVSVVARSITFPGLSVETGKALVSKSDFLEQNTLLEIKRNEPEARQNAAVFLHNNIRLVGLLVILTFLITVLGVFAGITFSQNNIVRRVPPVAIKTSPEIKPPVSSEESEVAEESSQSAAISEKNLKIVVYNGSGIAGEAEITKKLLEQKGFETIVTGNFPRKDTKQTLVVFSPMVTAKLREQILSTLKETFIEVSVNEASPAAGEVAITTGRKL